MMGNYHHHDLHPERKEFKVISLFGPASDP